MSKNYALKAEGRSEAGKGAARATRRAGKVPGVIYGDGKAPMNIALPVKEINLEYNKGRMYVSLCDLEVDGQKQLVLARDVQLHVVKDTVEHVDFMRVTPKTTLAVDVPVRFLNQENCVGIKAGGVLNVVRYQVELKCQATKIPEFIEIDITNFDIGDAIKISAFKLPEGAKPVITNRDFTVATIAAPRAIEEDKPVVAAVAEGAEGAAPAEGAEGAAAAGAEGGEAKAAEGAAKKEGGEKKGK